MRKDPKSEQLLSPFMSSVSVWNQISDHETTSHTPQSTNLFSQKFKESISSQDFEVGCPYHQQKKVCSFQLFFSKKAKYILIRDDGHQEKLCTKCAVVYAQQGLRVEEIHEDDVRKKQTDSFIQQLQDTKQQVDQVCVNMTRTESNIKQFYNDQYTQVVKTFSDVEKALQICKSQILQNLSQVMWQAIQITNQLRVQSKSIEHQISTYISDIRANYENIVHHMGTLPFNQIMGGYGSKLFKLQQCIKQLEDKQIPYLQFEGKETCLQNFIQEISRLREIHQPEDSFQQIKHHIKESTRSSSEQRQQRSSEKEKRHQSQPNRDHNINVQENSEKKNQTFKITEESIEEWMENSSTKQRQSKNLQTEPSENCHYSPNILASKFIKTSKPQRSLKQDTSQQLMDRLLEGFNQIKKERDHKKHIITKKMSKTPELAKTVQTSIQSKLAPKFLFKNYYK